MNHLPLFPLVEGRAVEVLGGIGRYTACVNDPPWTSLAPMVPPPDRLIPAWDMDVEHLDAVVAGEPDTPTVVGVGGGSALDTAKYVAWKTGKTLIQIPTITSVDAGFTDAAGIRVDRKVTYVGDVVPETVVLDVDLIRQAPPRLNRAGIGDILSCRTGLTDWAIADGRGEGVRWDDDLAALGEALLHELAEHADEIRRVSPDAVRWMASAYRRIGAACRLARHSRFEEGSEHFLGYCYEHLTGAHQVHGELIAMCTVAMSTLQDRAAEAVTSIVMAAGTRAHPLDLGIDRAVFSDALLALPGYVRAEGLDFSVVDTVDITSTTVDRLWAAVTALPREEP